MASIYVEENPIAQKKEDREQSDSIWGSLSPPYIYQGKPVLLRGR